MSNVHLLACDPLMCRWQRSEPQHIISQCLSSSDGFNLRLCKGLQFQVQVGNQVFPAYPLLPVAEHYYQLRTTVGKYNSSTSAMDISLADYRTNKVVIGINTSKITGAMLTGYNSKAGDLLTLRLNNKGVNATRLGTCKLHYELDYNVVLQITDTCVAI